MEDARQFLYPCLETMIVKRLIVLLVFLYFASSAAAQVVQNDSGPYPEIIDSIVGVVGVTYLFFITKKVGPVLKRGLRWVSIGLLVLTVSFVYQAATELTDAELSFAYELGFESFYIISMILITWGVKVIYEDYNKLLKPKKSP